jgi:hypothetical protein
VENSVKKSFEINSSHFISNVSTKDFDFSLAFKLAINVRDDKEILVMSYHQVQYGLIRLFLDCFTNLLDIVDVQMNFKFRKVIRYPFLA